MNFVEYVTGLRNSIRINFGCESVHIRTENVEVIHNEETLWEGKVESFALLKCEAGTQCYGWSIGGDDGATNYITVLRKDAVNSPTRAVQSHLADKIKLKK